MDANQHQQPPLIKIKPDLDPFQVYGSNPEDDDDQQDASIAIQSTRVKLAALRAQDKVNYKSDNDDDDADEIYKEADHDLEQILELEVLNKPTPSPNSAAVIKPPTVIITPKLTLNSYSGGENCEKEKLYESIKETFSEIFQVMIVMLESKAIFPQLPNEADKVSRKSKEFETRFSRTVFETKQQVKIITIFYTDILARKLKKICKSMFQVKISKLS